MNHPSKNSGFVQQKRLLLVEDNPLFVEQIFSAMQQQPQPWGVHVVEDGLRALSLIDAIGQHFDLALVDLGLPDISGIEVIKACHKRFPDMPVVVISVMASEPMVVSAIEAGAKGYLLKGESIQEITQGVARVMEGIYPLSPSLARFLFKRLSGETEKEAALAGQDFKLTPREIETLRNLSLGLSYERVAEKMGVSLSTIQGNVRNLYRKLNVRSQVQAISKARDHDLI